MKKTVAFFAFAVVFLGVATTVDAMRPTIVGTLDTPGTIRDLVLPAAAEHAHVISLGEAIDPQSGKIVEGIAILHPAKGFAKPDGTPGNGNGKGGNDGGDDTESSCYAFLGNGAAWKNTEEYIVDPKNNAGLSEAVILSLVADGLDTWDQEVAFDIFGVEGAGVVDGADSSAPDGKNEVLFGDISSNGTIGVTTVWGVFKGKPSNRELVEWDMVLDDADYSWTAQASSTPGNMDFSNIFVHEAGHALGLGHPADSCAEESMYRFAGEGEDKKRTLEAGDIAGVNNLY